MLTASATGSTFVDWTGACSGIAADCTLTVGDTQKVTANIGHARRAPVVGSLHRRRRRRRECQRWVPMEASSWRSGTSERWRSEARNTSATAISSSPSFGATRVWRGPSSSVAARATWSLATSRSHRMAMSFVRGVVAPSCSMARHFLQRLAASSPALTAKPGQRKATADQLRHDVHCVFGCEHGDEIVVAGGLTGSVDLGGELSRVP